jgi:hypothetical protein
MVISPLDVIVLVIGLVLYLIAGPPKVNEIGKIMFFAGLLAFLLASGTHVTRIG